MSLDYTIDSQPVKRLILIDATAPYCFGVSGNYIMDGIYNILSNENAPQLHPFYGRGS